jgi:hypothetical protein
VREAGQWALGAREGENGPRLNHGAHRLPLYRSEWSFHKRPATADAASVPKSGTSSGARSACCVSRWSLGPSVLAIAQGTISARRVLVGSIRTVSSLLFLCTFRPLLARECFNPLRVTAVHFRGCYEARCRCAAAKRMKMAAGSAILGHTGTYWDILGMGPASLRSSSERRHRTRV